MSKIEKLAIMGVRSFDNRKQETIKFNTPLTLIVGYNGSGKTTVIECLKYATTGELPTNSTRGGAFIHDPELCNEHEVLAQVKMSLRSIKGVKVVMTRNLQVTMKKSTRTQKTLEGHLKTERNGEITSISTKVAELDKMMPQFLGVSKAILEFVIFCHQDDSLWPMSEPGSLKKRFDEIFEALKYTKAIDNIKLLKKNQGIELAKHELTEAHCKEDKNKGAKIEKRSADLYDEIEVLRRQSLELTEQMKEAQTKSEEAYERAAQFEKIVARLDGKRIEAKALESNVTELLQNLKEMNETDEELQSHLDQYEERVALYRKDIEEHTEQYQELKQELDETRDSLGTKQSEVGKLGAQKEHHESQVVRRQTLVKETARRHNLRGFDLDVDDRKVREFMERIGRMAREQGAALDRAKRESGEELKKAQDALYELTQRKSTYSQNKEYCRTQIAENDRRIKLLQTDLEKITIDEAGKAAFESSIADIEQKLNSAKSEQGASNVDKRLADADKELRTNESHKDKLESELVEATSKFGETARLDVIKKDHQERQRGLDTMLGAHMTKLTSLLEESWTPATLEAVFQRFSATKASEVKEAEIQRNGTDRELKQVEYKLSNARSSLKEKQAEVQIGENEIREAADCEPNEFPDTLERLESDWSTVNDDASGFKHKAAYFENALKYLGEQDSCELCRRSFKKPSGELERFKARLQRILKKATDEVVEEENTGLKEELDRAKKVQSTHTTWKRLIGTEIPGLNSEIKELQLQYDKMVSQLEERDTVLSEKKDRQHDVESYGKTVQQITRYHAEIGQLQAQIKELSEKQKRAGSSRGLEEIKEDLKQVNERIRALRSEQSRLQTERERARSTINSLELEARDVRAKLSTAEYQLKEKTSIQTQIEDFRKANGQQREKIRSLDSDIQALAPQVDQAQLVHDDIKQRGENREKELQQEATKISDSLRHLKEIDNDINAYNDRGSDKALARAKREMENITAEVERVENEQRETAKKINTITETLRNTDDTKRAINDNLRYRKSSRQLQDVRAEIEQLAGHNAERDKEQYDREGLKWSRKRNELASQQAEVAGSTKSKDEALKQMLKDWETDYKDAAKNYKHAHIMVETTKAAITDLGRYGGALDKAIMKYHTLKMEEINRIIDELWRNTYQGTDVDTIMIRSDNETVKGNKSYNYRVVMVKQDAEMDMRGRCSAGQKMLACIIIRLALAECFGVNCGLIALDEPTTNLDRDNIRSLAQSLNSIIRVRKQQNNFQMIIITHDEEFLQFMQCSDYTDDYYRVQRGKDQKSEIKRQLISNVTLL